MLEALRPRTLYVVSPVVRSRARGVFLVPLPGEGVPPSLPPSLSHPFRYHTRWRSPYRRSAVNHGRGIASRASRICLALAHGHTFVPSGGGGASEKGQS
jgi:hypothetical protein